MRAPSLLLCLLVASGCKSHSSAPATPQIAPAPDANALYTQGKAALENKQLPDAVRLFTQATTTATDPDLRANAWLGLGAAYGELGDNTHAVAAWEQVTLLRPDDADAWRVLSEGLGQAGQRERQAKAMAHIIAIDPDDLAAYLDLASLYASLNKADETKDIYLRYENHRREAVVQLAKDKDPEARADAAEVLGGARDASTARALVLALTDKDATVRAACAQSLRRIGLEVDPEIRPALKLLLTREKDDKARAAIEDALK